MTATSPALTDEESALLPSEEDVDFYAEHGWFLGPKLLTDDEVGTLVEASDRFYAGHRDRTLPGRPEKLAYWTPADGQVQRHNDYVHYEDDALRGVLTKPLIGAYAAKLAEAAAIRIFQSTLIYKPPRPDEPTNVVPWHFDRHYWQSCTSERMLTAFIPMHDCTVELGTITMVDGSHLWKEIGVDDSTTKHFAERDRSELDRMLEENAAFNQAEVTKVPMVIPAGHMSFHHCRIYHGSDANRGDRPRRAISLHLQDGENHYREHRRSDGSVVVYNHDTLVRKTPDGRPDYADPDFCPTIWG
jgi:hypothetical protein